MTGEKIEILEHGRCGTKREFPERRFGDEKDVFQKIAGKENSEKYIVVWKREVSWK